MFKVKMINTDKKKITERFLLCKYVVMFGSAAFKKYLENLWFQSYGFKAVVCDM